MINKTLEELQQEFVAEGWGNGSLHPAVVPDPENYSGSGQEIFEIPFDFHYTDWEALYVGELKCPESLEPIDGEDVTQFDQRYRRILEECCSEFPLLSRIWRMYDDAVFNSAEVFELRRQCSRLQERTTHIDAWRALAKLIIASNKAIERGMGLILISD